MTAHIPPIPVVFIHGRDMQASAWEPWVQLFNGAGYTAIAPAWPAASPAVMQTRRRPRTSKKADVGLITNHYQAVIAHLPATPVVVGHGVGALVAQRLLGRGFARACIALAPVPSSRGVLRLQLNHMSMNADRDSEASPWHHALSGAKRQLLEAGTVFSWGEFDRLRHALDIHDYQLPLVQIALACVHRYLEATADADGERGPLLMIAGSADPTVPASSVYSAYKVQRRNTGVTEFAIFDRRGHALATNDRWREIAESALSFLARNGL